METNNKPQQRWGRWYLVGTRAPSLNIQFTRSYTYWIDLDTCRSQAQRKRWINHMTEKRRFIRQKDIIDLKLAFQDLLECGIIRGNNIHEN